jgi:hypothetical protein
VNPHSVHRICQEIRNWRNNLNADDKWARSIDHRETRTILIERVMLWRKVMDYAETLIVESGKKP